MRLNGISIKLHGKIQRIEQFAKIVAAKEEMHVYITNKLGKRERELRAKYKTAFKLMAKLKKDKIELSNEVEKMDDYLTLKAKVSKALVESIEFKELPKMKNSSAYEHETNGHSEAKNLLKNKIEFYEAFLAFIKAAYAEDIAFFEHFYERCYRYFRDNIEV
jgi:hypothetical protein